MANWLGNKSKKYFSNSPVSYLSSQSSCFLVLSSSSLFFSEWYLVLPFFVVAKNCCKHQQFNGPIQIQGASQHLEFEVLSAHVFLNAKRKTKTEIDWSFGKELRSFPKYYCRDCSVVFFVGRVNWSRAFRDLQSLRDGMNMVGRMPLSCPLWDFQT